MDLQRIQINGEWYVKETNTPSNVVEDIQVWYSQECTYETTDYVFTANRLYKSDLDSDFYDGIDITFTDKRPDDPDKWITETWDSQEWMVSVYNTDPVAIHAIAGSMCPVGIQQFRTFIHKLVQIGWLTIDK